MLDPMNRCATSSLRRLGLLIVLLLVPMVQVLAHHGWRWTEEGNVEVTGVIKSATLGNPHGVLILDVDGEEWRAEVGQPWRNSQAGLPEEKLVAGAEITIDGQKSADPEEKLVKAERVSLDGRDYILYPDRLPDEPVE